MEEKLKCPGCGSYELVDLNFAPKKPEGVPAFKSDGSSKFQCRDCGEKISVDEIDKIK